MNGTRERKMGQSSPNSTIHPTKNPAINVVMLGASLDVKGGITSVETLMLRHAPATLKIHHVPTFAPGSAAHNIKVFVQAMFRLADLLLNDRTIDLVHIHFSERGSTLRKMILFSVALPFGKPILLHAHGATYQEFFAGLPALARGAIAHLFQRCTQFVALSENWKAFYTQAFRLRDEQVTVLYNPVHLPAKVPSRLDAHLDAAPITFVFLGRIGRRGGALDAQSMVSFPQQDKGAFDLIQAFAQLSENDRQQATLILAGNGDIEQAQQLVASLHLSDRVTIHSWLNATERDALLHRADVFVLPSYNEGLPMSMLEAMAWGLPVIVTPVGGIPEVITHEQNGLLVEPGNHPAIAQAMHRLIHRKQLRLSLGQGARQTVQSFSIDRYMVSLLETYDKVVNPTAAIATPASAVKPMSIR